jgi:hypothetical protein
MSNVQVHNFVESISPATLMTSSGSVPVFGSAFFQLSNVSNVSTYTGLFDQYMIRTIEVLIEPAVTEVTSSASITGEWTSVVDIDDATLPTSYNDLQNYTTAVQTGGTLSHYHRWTPTVALAAYAGTFTSYASADNQWLDCASPSIQHYGIKAGCLTSASQPFTMTCRFHLSFRTRH